LALMSSANGCCRIEMRRGGVWRERFCNSSFYGLWLCCCWPRRLRLLARKMYPSRPSPLDLFPRNLLPRKRPPQRPPGSSRQTTYSNTRISQSPGCRNTCASTPPTLPAMRCGRSHFTKRFSIRKGSRIASSNTPRDAAIYGPACHEPRRRANVRSSC
jgi:hypothetical protein